MSHGKRIQNVLVTGARGFIGLNLVRELLSQSIQVRALDNLSLVPENPTCNGLFQESEPLVWRKEPCLVRGDVRDQEVLEKAIKGADAVIHLAANSGVQQSIDSPLGDMDCNIKGTLTCLEAARKEKISSFVFASSGAPLGATLPPVNELSLPRPISPYGVSKLAGEAYCSAYAHSFGLKCIALRFANVYGPYSTHKTSVVGRFLSQAFKGENWEVYGDGTQTRDFIYVGDLVLAITLALRSENIQSEIFHIASSVETPILEITEILGEMLEKSGKMIPKIEFKSKRIGDMQRSRANIDKARKILQWSPKCTLGDGLQETVNWFVEHYS